MLWLFQNEKKPHNYLPAVKANHLIEENSQFACVPPSILGRMCASFDVSVKIYAYVRHIDNVFNTAGLSRLMKIKIVGVGRCWSVYDTSVIG